MAYTKADYFAAYRVYAVDPVTKHRFCRFRSPDVAGGEELTCILHYHPRAIKPMAADKAQKLVDRFEADGTPLDATSCVVVIGGAFGWLGEALEDLVPGLEAASVDTSDYVQQVKEISPDDEVIEQLEASGYDITTGGGKHMYDIVKTNEPRSRSPERVVNNNMSSNKLRNDVKKLFQRNDVTHIVTEEVWQILDQQTQDSYTAAAASYGATMIHIIDGVFV